MRFRTLSGNIPTPVAGAGFTFTFSPIERVKIHSLLFTFTADVVVANRFVWAQLQDPNNVPVFEAGSPTAIAAAGVTDFVLSPRFGSVTAMQGKVNPAVGLPWPDVWLPPSWKLVAGAVAEDPGDTFTAITFAADYSEDVWHKNQDAAAWQAYLATLS